jgi:hypothetical protein
LIIIEPIKQLEISFIKIEEENKDQPSKSGNSFMWSATTAPISDKYLGFAMCSMLSRIIRFLAFWNHIGRHYPKVRRNRRVGELIGEHEFCMRVDTDEYLKSDMGEHPGEQRVNTGSQHAEQYIHKDLSKYSTHDLIHTRIGKEAKTER